MDTGHCLIAAVTFVGGWLLREFTTGSPEASACNCHCTCASVGQPSGTSWSALLTGGIALALLIVISTQAALIFKVSVKSGEGQRELALQVKGKSKGVYGAQTGFQLLG